MFSDKLNLVKKFFKMSAFIDQQAEESDNDGEHSGSEMGEPKAKKSKKTKKRNRIR